jgi:hypothetical protein
MIVRRFVNPNFGVEFENTSEVGVGTHLGYMLEIVVAYLTGKS